MEQKVGAGPDAGEGVSARSGGIAELRKIRGMPPKRKTETETG